jgi:hypothetical protein
MLGGLGSLAEISNDPTGQDWRVLPYPSLSTSRPPPRAQRDG